MRNPQHGTDARNRPAQAPIDANGAQAIREGFSAGPAPQSLRTAQQIMRGLLGRNRGAVHQFQRGELLGLSSSAAGVCAVTGRLHGLPSMPTARALRIARRPGWHGAIAIAGYLCAYMPCYSSLFNPDKSALQPGFIH